MVQILALLGVVCMLGALIVVLRSEPWASWTPRKLLDAELELRSEGASWTFTTESPGPVMIVVEMPDHCSQDGRIDIAPLYLALRPQPVYEVDKEPEHTFVVPRTGLPSTRVELARAGPYVIRMDAIPMAMGNEANPPRARVRVLRAP